MARYSRLPNPSSPTDEELEAAFDDSDDERDDLDRHKDSTRAPLLPTHTAPSDPPSHPLAHSYSPVPQPTNLIPGGYDFEYDYPPPPGSPPPPSALALPNSIGNSNGLLPTTSPLAGPPRPLQTPSIFHRAFRSIWPGRRPELNQAGVGGGQENDGVFANITAKPTNASLRPAEGASGAIGIAPETSPDDAPPSYQVAQADAVPPYWETTIFSPRMLGSDIVIENLPTGSFLYFCWSLLISVSFQFVGFALTYMMHTTHAAKFGSLAGLGMTLIQTGFYMREEEGNEANGGYQQWGAIAETPAYASMLNSTSPAASPEPSALSPSQPISYLGSTISFLLMAFGWFLVISSFLGYARIKRIERALLHPPAPPQPPTAEEVEQDMQLRRRLHEAFGIVIGDDRDEPRQPLAEAPSETTPDNRSGRRPSLWV